MCIMSNLSSRCAIAVRTISERARISLALCVDVLIYIYMIASQVWVWSRVGFVSAPSRQLSEERVKINSNAPHARV